jgi:O-antigen/teichoic acid export membrane protein
VLPDRSGLLRAGPAAAWSELSSALGLLLASSVLAQMLAYLALLVANVAEGGTGSVARSFTNAFFVARIPVLMFMAVQAALLPKLARLAASERHMDFRAALIRLLLAVVGVAVVGTALAGALGPFVGGLVFPRDFSASRSELALLAAGSGVFIIGQTITQALIALKSYGRVAGGWLAGCLGYVAVQLTLHVHTTLEVSVAFLAGSTVATISMGLLLVRRMRGILPESPEAIFETIAREPVEL